MDANGFDHLPSDAFGAAAVGMALLDPQSGRYLRVNPALCRMLLREEVDLLRSSHEDLTHPDDRSAYRERARRMLAGEIDSWQVEKAIKGGDGDYRWVRASGALVRDRDGRPYFFTQYQDLSERRRAEGALQHSEVSLHSAAAAPYSSASRSASGWADHRHSRPAHRAQPPASTHRTRSESARSHHPAEFKVE